MFKTGRGGQFTYHGPGQRVGYVMLDLKRRKADVRAFVHDLEEWLIRTLAQFNVKGERREGRVGIWVARGGARRQDRRHRRARAPLGDVSRRQPQRRSRPHAFLRHRALRRREHGVTSLHDLGLPVSMADVDVALKQSFDDVVRTRIRLIFESGFTGGYHAARIRSLLRHRHRLRV